MQDNAYEKIMEADFRLKEQEKAANGAAEAILNDESDDYEEGKPYFKDDTQHKKVQLHFPKAAWNGLFGEWRDMVKPCTEASLESLWAAFLVGVGMALGRNMWKNSPR